MLEKIQQAASYVNSGKFKKALVLLKKNNAKLVQQTFLSLELEGICLFQIKKFPLAEITFKNSLLKAEDDKEKVSALNNLKSTAFNAGNKKNAIKYLIEIIKIDPSIKTALYRFELCKLASLEKDYLTVAQYVAKLSTFSEYSNAALILSVEAFCALKDESSLNSSLNRISHQMMQFSGEEVNNLLSILCSNQYFNHVKNTLKLVEHKFSHEQWYKQHSILLSKELKPNSEKMTKVVKPIERVLGSTKINVKLIKAIIAELEGKGASFHKDLRFIEENGELSIRSFAEDCNVLIQVPMSCMPLLADYNISIVDEKFTITLDEEAKNPNAFKVMGLLIDLYNKTEKIKTWKATYPLLSLQKHPEFVEQFLSHFGNLKKVRDHLCLYENKQWDALLINSFFSSREFDFSREILEKVNIKISEPLEKGLLTVIDFLNHSSSAQGYLVNNKTLNMEIKPNSSSFGGEVFVKYNFVDPVITYFIYGFVDTNSPILYSGITTLKTFDGQVLKVLGSSGQANTLDIHDYQHLHNFIPANLNKNEHGIHVNSLIIPDEHGIHTLKQVLKFILLKFDEKGIYADENTLENEIRNLERQLVLKNMKLWEKAKNSVDYLLSNENNLSIATQENLISLYEFSLAHINNYMKKANVTLI